MIVVAMRDRTRLWLAISCQYPETASLSISRPSLLISNMSLSNFENDVSKILFENMFSKFEGVVMLLVAICLKWVAALSQFINITFPGLALSAKHILRSLHYIFYSVVIKIHNDGHEINNSGMFYRYWHDRLTIQSLPRWEAVPPEGHG